MVKSGILSVSSQTTTVILTPQNQMIGQLKLPIGSTS
jgi:hypothetical protein